MGNHWLFAVLRLEDYLLQIFDSYGNFYATKANDFKNRLIEILNHDLRERKMNTIDDLKVELLNIGVIPQQMGGIDCGISTIGGMEDICNGLPMPATVNMLNVNNRRRQIFEKFRTYE